MRKYEEPLHIQLLRKKAESLKGQQARVEGMWTGDFIGTVLDPRQKTCDFRVDEPLSRGESATKAGEVVSLPYGEYMKIKYLQEQEPEKPKTAAESFRIS